MVKSETLRKNLFLLVLLSIDLIWVRSSLGKIIEGKFIGSLGMVLTKFASNNPYTWYKNFLTSTVIPNSTLLGNLILIGEVFTAFSLLIGITYLLFMKKENKAIYVLMLTGLITGLLLNLNFWLASGWTSPSADSLNLLMVFIELIGLKYLIISITSLRTK